MFDADKPILKSEQDCLQRTVFAKYLARCILDHNSPESLVIGLAGGPGVGKTSIINMTLEELHYAASNMFDDEKPIILNFSPWSYSGQQQLIYSFFRRLSFQLRQAEYLENAEKIIHLLELYISFFTHQPVPKALQPKHHWFTRLFKRRKILQDALGWESGRDLTQVKAELNALLSKQKHKIIVIIDNIDRIEDSEIKQIFQIVKSMGDYAHTVYLLSYDKQRVLNAIQRFHGSNGTDYLDKVIQLPFAVPEIATQDLEKILFSRLKNLIALAPADTWDTDYWTDLYYSNLRKIFTNCRDITRYVNTLSFGFSRVKDIVNPVDFFALTAIEVFAPQVYFGIHDNKDLFADLVDNVYHFNAEKLQQDKARCDETLNRTEKVARADVQQLLIRLFPRLRGIYQASTPFFHSEAIARKNRRICSPDMFDVYFRLSLPTGQISAAEITAILAAASDADGLTQALLRLNQDERAIKFLNLLDEKTLATIPTENIPHVIKALIETMDLFPEGESSSLYFNTPMRVHRILHHLLHRFDTTEQRFLVLQDAINNATNSVYSIVFELSEQTREHVETEDVYLPLEHRDLSPTQLETLQKLAVSKIESWAASGRLAEHPKLLPILYAWQRWGNETDCKKFVAHIAESDRGVIAFLNAALKDAIDEAILQLEKNPAWKNNLKNIEDFIDPKKIEPHVKVLFEDQYFEKLREREQLAILIFLDLMGSKTVKVIPKT